MSVSAGAICRLASSSSCFTTRPALILAESSRVVVTWIQGAESVELDALGIDAAQAADLRHRLSAFAEDWDGPEMAVYDELPSR